MMISSKSTCSLTVTLHTLLIYISIKALLVYLESHLWRLRCDRYNKINAFRNMKYHTMLIVAYA